MKRYDIEAIEEYSNPYANEPGIPVLEITEVSNGDWVKFEDYQDVESSLDLAYAILETYEHVMRLNCPDAFEEIFARMEEGKARAIAGKLPEFNLH